MKFLLLNICASIILLFSFCKKEEVTEKSTPEIKIKKDSIIKMDILNPDKKFTNLNEDCFSLHYDAFVIDTHNDFIYQVLNKGANFSKKDNFTQTGLQRFKEGGVDLQVFAIWIPMSEMKRSYSFTLNQINRFKKIETENNENFEFANSFDDIQRIFKEKKFCGLMGIEGGTAIENKLDNINEFFRLGVRYIGLTWNNSNKIATSAKDESNGIKGGLTEFGFEVIKRMDEVGMLIDVSHVGENSFWDIIKTSKNPIIASHSNCYSINPHYRNLTDEQIKAIAKTGGMISVNFYDEFINENAKEIRAPNFYKQYTKNLNEIFKNSEGNMLKFNNDRYDLMLNNEYKKGVSVDKLIDHIDYIKKLVGADYIGLGSDFDGGITPPTEIYDGTCYPIITKKLVERGYTELEIRKILGLNFLRVFKQVCG